MNNNPMNGFGMNTNGVNGGGYPPMGDNSNMTTGNPTLDLLNQSNGISPNATPMPTNTGNPTLDLLNQSQNGFVPPMDGNNGMDMNFNQPQPASTFGVDNNMGMTPTMNQPMVQQPLDASMQQPQMNMNPMDSNMGQFANAFNQQPMPMGQVPEQPMMQPAMDYSNQMVQQPLTSMEAQPTPIPTPAVETTTNPYGFVPMMPPVSEEQPQKEEPVSAPATAPSTTPSEFNFSFIPLRDENNQSSMDTQQPQANMEPVNASTQPVNDFNQQPMAFPGQAPEQPMMQQPTPDFNGQMPVEQPMMQQPTPDFNGQMPVGYPQPNMVVNAAPQMNMNPVQPVNNFNQQPMAFPGQVPEQPMMQQPVPDFNGQMPVGYPQPMPPQNPNAFPGVPDNDGNFPQ